MRHILLILLSLVPMLSTAQTLTEAQKQEALQTATKFCNLLARFSNGERTLNTQINALCSGADCSAFDDIKTNKEVTLRNYLMAIQQKYPKKLAMTVSSPSLAGCKVYVQPSLTLGSEWGNVGESELSTNEIVTLSVDNIDNYYVVFDVIQKYTSLGVSTNKKLIYDVKNKKITAFIKNDGAFINFLNGLMAYCNKDYKNAIAYFERAAQNDRSSLRKNSYGFAMVCCIMAQDFGKGAYYAEKMGDQLYISYFNMVLCFEKEDYESTYPYVQIMERQMNCRTDLNKLQRGNVYIMLGTYYAMPSSHSNTSKSLQYLKVADEIGMKNAGYMIFIWYTLYIQEYDENYCSDEFAYTSLYKSAKSGYPPAFYQWGIMEEYIKENTDEALVWYEKAAQFGNMIAMASAGKIYIEKGNKTKGVDYLKKALQGSTLDAQLKDNELNTGGLAPWPKSRADVETLLNKYNSAISSSSYSSTNTPSTSTPSSSYNSSSSYSYRKRHKFNEAKDSYCVGLSVGYVQKQWVYDYGDSKEKVDMFGENKFTNGIQAGLRIDPQFGYGFGINTGLFYEFYFDKSEDLSDDGYGYHYTSEEHSLYLPIHLKYSLNFSEWFQLSFYGGIGLDYGLSGKIHYRGDDDYNESFNMYEEDLDIKRFNTSLEYGASVRIKNIQLDLTMASGLINMSDNEGYEVKQNKLMNISASICF